MKIRGLTVKVSKYLKYEYEISGLLFLGSAPTSGEAWGQDRLESPNITRLRIVRSVVILST